MRHRCTALRALRVSHDPRYVLRPFAPARVAHGSLRVATSHPLKHPLASAVSAAPKPQSGFSQARAAQGLVLAPAHPVGLALAAPRLRPSRKSSITSRVSTIEFGVTSTSINSAPMSLSGSVKLRYENCLGIWGNASYQFLISSRTFTIDGRDTITSINTAN